jgi:hypothetical protein
LKPQEIDSLINRLKRENTLAKELIEDQKRQIEEMKEQVCLVKGLKQQCYTYKWNYFYKIAYRRQTIGLGVRPPRGSFIIHNNNSQQQPALSTAVP